MHMHIPNLGHSERHFVQNFLPAMLFDFSKTNKIIKTVLMSGHNICFH